MSQLRALGLVLYRRLAEIDTEIKFSQNERETAWLWRIRSGVRKLIRALIGPDEVK